jgi:hypothetical protein
LNYVCLPEVEILHPEVLFYRIRFNRGDATKHIECLSRLIADKLPEGSVQTESDACAAAIVLTIGLAASHQSLVEVADAFHRASDSFR